MSIQSIRIKNILSFEDLEIKSLSDINCIVGKNNVGKSNLLKTIKYFYDSLANKTTESLPLQSNYTLKGSISLTFDTTRIHLISKKNPNNHYFSFISRKIIPNDRRGIFSINKYDHKKTFFTLTLYIYNDNSKKWSTNDRQVHNLILYLYPFFYIEPRRMNLYEWDDLWDLISTIKSFNLSTIDNEKVINFFNDSINQNSIDEYKNFVTQLENIITVKKLTPKEKILTYVKSGLTGHSFEIDSLALKTQSDGTNSYHFINIFLKILISLSKREYITPFIFIDEPEIGLHPKMNEQLIKNIHSYYNYKKNTATTIPPKIFITSHSPIIIKQIIKNFREKQNIYCFRKNKSSPTELYLLNSDYKNESFINILSENEARLFFSDFILFVEGETELEAFGNIKLANHFQELQKIDIYKCSSNVIGERINPSFSNSAIPYLFLFDADKAWDISYKSNKTFLNIKSNGEYFKLDKKTLEKQRENYSKGYNFKYQLMRETIDNIIESIGIELKINLTKQIILTPTFHNTISELKTYLRSKSIYINNTTFEECLISYDSREVFYEWIKHEYSVDITPIISRFKASKVIDEHLLIDYMRVLFNGKTKILNNKKPFNNETSKTTKKARFLLQKLNKFLNITTPDKADGWVTKYIDFSINFIEEKVAKKEDFQKQFKVYFPELYDIIKQLQSDS
ncbi:MULTISPECIES: retron Eco8 family effector endonuclease [unclassified Shewanella]|uniref:retron Eco8 family effector endonuclease n=1 Tax=unclassified Shewanella TaxID=196818 RepID=UPI00200667A0|nr:MULTISPECIES: retron Eco8 family effector endonuclease [unclassified Shewanella]MCK7634441.1 retron Eco8 family effector endonuclease [Shewanella sp. JNE17]MCK7649559.1 retron Eco8 family effector endonuclease [Shewanella sp. JNE8]MCK7657870.1 retron Eco8 family effector endonuclease [Shewanella sp. JNE4-2]MCU8082763.1 retron Eco8 family effector endonuclease [Shewanella sp. SM23]UPO30081.1 retron Eco8 family effector endonuclease [Shewanella sp. JNE2]